MAGQDLYRLFFEESSDALLAIVLSSGQIKAASNSFSALMGFGHEEIVGESIHIFNSLSEQSNKRERVLNLELLSQPGFYSDITLRTREGESRYVTVKVKHVDLDNEKIAITVLSDDTERLLLMRDLATKHYTLETAYSELESVHFKLKSTQEKMFKASKLVALGELAAGISHELNQPLTGVRGFAEEIADILTNDKSENSETLKDLSREIVENSEKMASLLAHLRSFAREEKQNNDSEGKELKKVSLSSVISNVTKLFEKQLQTKDIQLDIRNSEEELFAQAIAHPVEQIVINLLANARDAIAEKAKSEKNFHGHILVNLSQEKGFVELRVSDNGPGVPSPIQEQIFNPFFTTKAPNEGMGLGLALSFSIAHRFNGELSLESTSPSGTTFLLRLKSSESTEGKKAA